MEVEEKRQGLPAFRETASSETLDLVLPLVLHLGGDAEVSKGTEKTTAPPPPPSPPPHNPFSGFGSTSQQMSNMLAANQAAWAAVQARLAKLTTSADATASLKSIVTAWHLANRWDAAVAMEAIGEHLLEVEGGLDRSIHILGFAIGDGEDALKSAAMDAATPDSILTTPYAMLPQLATLGHCTATAQLLPPKAPAKKDSKSAKTTSSKSSGSGKAKKKWSKGKTKDKANNAIVFDKPTYDKIMKEVPTYKMISVSTLVDRMKINGSLARVAIRSLEKEGLIKRIVHHRGQLIYTRATAATD